MATIVRSISINTNDPNGVLPLAANDVLFVLPGVQISNSNTSSTASAVSLAGAGTIFNQGQLLSASYGILGAASGAAAEIVSVATGASVVGLAGISSSNGQANWTVNVDKGGLVSGATNGFDFAGQARTTVLGTISGASGNGMSDIGSLVRTQVLTVGPGGAVTGGTTGLSSTNASAIWNISVAAGGVISGGTDGVRLASNAFVQVAGAISGGVNDGILGPATGGGTIYLTVANGGSVFGNADGVESLSSTAAWRLTVAEGGSIAGGANGATVTGGGLFNVLGQVSGGNGDGLLVTGSAPSEIFIGERGAITSTESAGVSIASSLFSIENHGQIRGGTSANALETFGAGVITNFGEIGGPQGRLASFWAVSNGDTNVNHTVTTINYGVMRGDRAYSGNTSVDRVFNSGLMDGAVVLGGGTGALFDSTQGRVNGVINCGNGGDTVVAGNTGGLVTGGTGNDILYANPTQTAVNNAAQTTLNGGGGNNALYGDGAYTTFLAGAGSGSTNQIWGAASQMARVSGYVNNTISFANAARGVYVDLLNGHNAFISNTTNWAGAGAFEDWIAAAGTGLSTVPNVIGSNNLDVIIADAGVDRIAGGGGADQLYAGTGAASQDTFVYNSLSDSSIGSGYDTIVGFKIGVDKIDVSGFMQAFGLGPNSLAIFTNGTSNTVYIQRTPGTLNTTTDLALVVNTSAAGGLHGSDFIF